MHFSGFPAARVIDPIRSSAPAAILLEPAPRLDLAHWELPMILNVHMRVDRAFFQKALEGCREFERIRLGNGLEFMLYDCAPHHS